GRDGAARVQLVPLRVDASGGGVEDLVGAVQPDLLEDVQVDRCAVVQDGSVVVTREHEPCPAHVSCQLIHLVELLAVHTGTGRGVAQVSDDELVGGRGGELRILQVCAPDPVALALEALNEMAPDEAASTKYQCPFHSLPPAHSLDAEAFEAELLCQGQDHESRVVPQVSQGESPRLSRHAEDPLEPGTLHPYRRLWLGAGVEVERCAYPDHHGH